MNPYEEALKQKTKNSAKHVTHDALDEKDHGWDDLNDLFKECNALTLYPSQALPLLNNPEQMKRVKEAEGLTEAVKVLSKDVATYGARLEEIHNKHAGKTGSSGDGDELIQIVNIGEAYQQWMYNYQTVVLPVVGQVMNYFAGEDVTGGDIES